MSRQLLNSLRRGGGYVRKHPQLLMTLLLVGIIPVAFLINGQQFLNAARSNQERLEMERIGLLHDLFSSVIRQSGYDSSRIQAEMTRLSSLNPDITKFRVLREEGDELRIIASLSLDEINTYADNAGAYRMSNASPNESIITPYAESGIRYWQSFKLITDSDHPDHYLFAETSLEHIDRLFASRILSAYWWLIGLVAIVLTLLVRHVRLIDYAYLYAETKRANETKDLFTNMIAHELRAPLTAIRGYASIIREAPNTSGDVEAHAKRIEESSGRLLSIVSDLLDVARIQSGKLTIEQGEVDIAKLIASVIDVMSVTLKDPRVAIGHEGIHSATLIRGDEKRLFQVLTNLVSNAVKYTERGSITVSLENREDRVEIRVKDTGMGISADNQKNLFAPFFRVESNEVRSITGTGLGMWITKQLVELMGGSIGVESIRGVGTHVVLTLPKALPYKASQ